MSKVFAFDWFAGVLLMVMLSFLPKQILDKLLVGISRRDISVTIGIIVFTGYVLGVFYRFSEIYYFHIIAVALGYLWFSFKSRASAILLANFAVQVILSAKQNIFPTSFIALSLSKFFALMFFGIIVTLYWQRMQKNQAQQGVKS